MPSAFLSVNLFYHNLYHNFYHKFDHNCGLGVEEGRREEEEGGGSRREEYPRCAGEAIAAYLALSKGGKLSQGGSGVKAKKTL